MITEFKVGAAHTINLGNFESLRVEAHVIVEVTGDQTAADLYAPAQLQLKNLLEQTVREQMRPLTPQQQHKMSPGVEAYLKRQQERS